MSAEREDPVEVAASLHRERYPGARVIFVAGSAARREDTPGSDLDLVVVFDRLPHAYRESFLFRGWPVEAVVYDLETLKYFLFEVDVPSGNPVWAEMIADSIEVPDATPLSQSLKQTACALLSAGPPPLSEREERLKRYVITSIVGDLRQPRPREQLLASGTVLYDQVAFYYFRTRRLWATSGKLVPKWLRKADEAFAEEFCASFAELFRGSPTRLIKLVEELLAPHGGLLFDGYRMEAPAKWRKSSPPDAEK
jgi:predicted nucleotidyltransferase